MESFHLCQSSTIYIHTNPGIEVWSRDVFRIDNLDVIQLHYAAVSAAHDLAAPGKWSVRQTKRIDPIKGRTKKM